MRPVRPKFTSHMEWGAAACGVRLRWLSDGWLAQLAKGGRTKYVIGYSFPLNDDAAAQIANDKAATYTVLAECRIPAIVHRVFRFGELSAEQLAQEVLDVMPLPLVVKPHGGSSGTDVLRARDDTELNEAMRVFVTYYRAIILSPYAEIKHEYRVVVLNQDVRIVYEKHRLTGWRHNLHGGVVSRLVNAADLVAALSVLARRAARALNLRFAAVDIVEVEDRLAVLEVNNTVSLERFSSHAPAHAELARIVYRDAIAACFADIPAPDGMPEGATG
jgi:glutathione synthase/RimK-type ligase-like ATP-grasp enzyme